MKGFRDIPKYDNMIKGNEMKGSVCIVNDNHRLVGKILSFVNIEEEKSYSGITIQSGQLYTI